MNAEARFGLPNHGRADQLLINRTYTIGYSYLHRSARWCAYTIEDGDTIGETTTDRTDVFRVDARIPPQFATEPGDYLHTGYDRGHLLPAGARRRESTLEQSETFLMSNVVPQLPDLNRGPWKNLEIILRKIVALPDIHEAIVVCGPCWSLFEQELLRRPDEPARDVIPIPVSFFKTVLLHSASGRLDLITFDFGPCRLETLSEDEPDDWGFLLDYEIVPTSEIESRTGLRLFPDLVSERIEKQRGDISQSEDLFRDLCDKI